MNGFLILYLCTYYIFVETVVIQNPIIQLEDGKVQGKLSKTNQGNFYYEFHQIPYATPPLGNLRLAEPIPPTKWSHVLDGTKITKMCIHKFIGVSAEERRRWFVDDERENEDCLYINVLTPNLPDTDNHKDKLLPVYFYIYGGIFSFGDPYGFDFQYILDEDIVIVILTYRSSSLGFLSTGDGVIPANLGLKDQLMALKWVKTNIAKFGGDPTKVTIGGHSSGAALTGYHLLSPKSKGLFRSAIIQSGSPLQSVSYHNKNRLMAFKLGEMLSSDFHSSQNTSEDLLKLLRSFPAQTVARTEFSFPDGSNYPLLGYRPMWVPTVEEPDHNNAFVIGAMHDNLKEGNFNHIPIMIGTSDEERKFFNPLPAAALAGVDNKTLLDPLLDIKEDHVNHIINEIKRIYFNNSSFDSYIPGIIKLSGELVFAMPVKLHAYLHSKFADVYFYQFSYMGPINRLYDWKTSDNYKYKDALGNSGHGDELQLLFNFKIKNEIPPSELDFLMRKRIVKLWTNFIKYTNPTPKQDPILQNITWPKMNNDSYRYLEIASTLRVGQNPPRLSEWLNKIDKYFGSPRFSY